MEGVPDPHHPLAMRGRKYREKGVSQIFDLINKIVRIVKNKNSGPSIKRKKTPRSATGRAIGLGMILAVSISVAIGCDSQNKSREQAGENIESQPSPEIPVALESYWDLQKESNCSSSKVKVPSGYAALICNISDINMINLFVFSWEPVKQANKRNGAKYKTLYHEVYFVPINYRWERVYEFWEEVGKA